MNFLPATPPLMGSDFDSGDFDLGNFDIMSCENIQSDDYGQITQGNTAPQTQDKASQFAAFATPPQTQDGIFQFTAFDTPPGTQDKTFQFPDIATPQHIQEPDFQFPIVDTPQQDKKVQFPYVETPQNTPREKSFQWNNLAANTFADMSYNVFAKYTQDPFVDSQDAENIQSALVDNAQDALVDSSQETLVDNSQANFVNPLHGDFEGIADAIGNVEPGFSNDLIDASILAEGFSHYQNSYAVAQQDISEEKPKSKMRKSSDDSDDYVDCVQDVPQDKPKKKRKSAAGRKLFSWNEDAEALCLLALQYYLKREGIKIDWNEVGAIMSDRTTKGSITQHLERMRKDRIEKGLKNPPSLAEIRRRPSKKRSALVAPTKTSKAGNKQEVKEEPASDDGAPNKGKLASKKKMAVLSNFK